MNFPSNILGIFSKHGGKIAPTDAAIQVPPAIQPVLEIPTPTNLLGNGAGFPLQNASFMLDFTQAVTNAAGALDTSIVTIAPGLWDLTINFMWTTDDSTAFGRSYIYVRDTTTLLSVVFQGFYTFTTLGAHQGQRTVRLAIIPQTSWDVRVGIANTAAGKTTKLDGCLIANRMG